MCYITNKQESELFPKKLFKQQVCKKIYTMPKENNYKKSVENSGIEETESKKYCGQQIKLNDSHFKKKKLHIGDIEFESLGTPMRSSTPTPSDASTILAGHLDFGLGDDDMGLTGVFEAANEQNGDLFKPIVTCEDMSMAADFTKPKETPAETNSNGPKGSYCSEWMAKENGVSLENADIPPSIFDNTVSMSDSLLDITSVSRNNVQNKPVAQKHNGSGISLQRVEAYKNVTFM